MKSSELNKPLRLNLNTVEVPFTTNASVILDLPIPASLWGVNPRRLLGKKWWDTMRKQVYRRNNRCCLACGISEQLDAHERYVYDFENHISTFTEIIPLCHKCHLFIHWRSVENPKKRRDILIHGMNLLKKNHLRIPETAFRAAGIWAFGAATKLYITDEIRDSLTYSSWKLDMSNLHLTDEQINQVESTLPWLLGKIIINKEG